ncbi:hypothetical protein R1flu_022290 [Riccia fluitans]|uniref:Uncharacterized protein n=1 Tax=Riccia fluitans TaxID=41844 RepID=A0ABD1ZSC5_9MARC
MRSWSSCSLRQVRPNYKREGQGDVTCPAASSGGRLEMEEEFGAMTSSSGRESGHWSTGMVVVMGRA